jgi:amidohydrolase
MMLYPEEQLIQLRHQLHAQPELSGQEHETRKKIYDFFKVRNPGRIKKIGETGIMITYSGESTEKNVLLRAEMDALPIQERNTLDYRSRNDGIAHMCGHDGHMTMLAGIGDWCSKNRLKRTTVHLLFQPAEETGQGAKAILSNPDFDIDPDCTYAIHNIPGYDKNLILLKENYFSAHVISLVVELTGRTSHAAEPEAGINPALAVSEIIQVFDKFNNNDKAKDDFFIITPVFLNLGKEAFGTSAGDASLGFTLRCWSIERMKEMQHTIKRLLEGVANIHHLDMKYNWTEEFYPNHNDAKEIKMISGLVDKMNGKFQYLTYPFKWGEDFGFFTSQYQGAMIGLGAGKETPALHNPDYDFPDDIIKTGINLYKSILLNIDKS